MSVVEQPLLVVGDVHGDSAKLAEFFEEFTNFRGLVVMVGDYINRGPDSRGVLDILQKEKDRRSDNLVLLRGNHEAALLNFLQGGPVADFARHGGMATMSSYLQAAEPIDAVNEFRQAFPLDHLAILHQTSFVHVTDTTLVSHGGFNTESPLDFSSSRVIDGDLRLFSFSGPWPRSTVVVGHYLQASQQPHITEHLIAIDTGCGTLSGAPLTAVRLPERTIFQF